MGLSREDKLVQLERVLQSRTLQSSESLRAFLRFVVLKSVNNQEGDLKEYTIATEVFGRNSHYDPRSDSTVRVQAGRLRSKLHEYYTTEGRDDKIVIDLPKGHYSPLFSYAPPGNGASVTVSAASLSPAGAVEPQTVSDKRLRLAIAALTILSVVFGIAALSYRSEVGRLSRSGSDAAAPASDGQMLWGDFLRSPDPILAVFSNTLFEGTAESGMKLVKPWDSPVPSSGSPAEPQLSADSNRSAQVLTEHYTGTGEVMGMYFLSDLFARLGRPLRVKRSLLLNWDDLKTSNIVVLGSPAENYLIRNLPQKQEFVFRSLKDDKQNNTFGLVNLEPQNGEQPHYLARQEGPSRSQISEDYALISMLRGLEANRRLLILAGVTTFGTQAAAEYVTKPEYVRDLISHLDTSAASDATTLPSFYQVVIKVKVNGGVPVQISYVTHHVLE
jgi:hypothetical protein